MKLHPDIVAFWERKGYTVEPRFKFEHDDMLWDAIEYIEGTGKCIRSTIAHTIDRGKYPPQANPDLYFFDGKSYTEEQMLKIIKLIAFI